MKKLHPQFLIKNIIVLIPLIVLGIFISCSPSQKDSQPVQVQQQIQTLQTLVEPEIPATVSPVQEIIPVETVQPTETVMLNPPHGEPFHRCDIPVGSPLNVPAPASASASVSATPASNPNPTINRSGTSPTIENAARFNGGQVNTPTAQPLATSGQPTLNPPHGQPFHRCDIAVGSPLPVN